MARSTSILSPFPGRTPELVNSTRTVLALTGAEDPTADAVISELTRRGVRVARTDLGGLPGADAIHRPPW